MDKVINTKMMLYLLSLMKDINCEKYLCDMAHYSLLAYMKDGKIYIHVGGNSGKITSVCNFIVNSILNKNIITNKNFDTTKYVLETSDKNFAFEAPWKRLGMFFNKTMCHKFYSPSDRLSVISTLTKDNTINVIDDILNVTSVTMLVSGNATESLTNELVEIFSKFTPKKIYNPDILFIDTYGTPNTCNDCNIFTSENEHETNSAGCVNIFIEKIQYGVTENWNRYVCLLSVLDNIISTNYYDNLRTKEKYGYVVGSSKFNAGDGRCLSKYYKFVTQSPHKSAKEIIERTKLFITQFKDVLDKLTDAEFLELKTACINELSSPYRNLGEKSNFIFESEIETDYTAFNLKDVLIQTYKSLTKEDLVSFYHDKFINLRSVSIGINTSKK
jgi:secreted Zn-dependent insulinase-like peptidase